MSTQSHLKFCSKCFVQICFHLLEEKKMLKFIALLSALAVTCSYAQSTGNTANAKVLCYYDSSSFVREGEFVCFFLILILKFDKLL